MYRIIETDVKDKRGEVVITPGLKVRHKDSQFEYTVDNVVQGADGGLEIILKLPDEARFSPPDVPGDVIHAQSKKSPGIIYEIDPSALYYEPEEHEDEVPETISVSQDEFEKEYEVK